MRELVRIGIEVGAEEFFVEPVNPRGGGPAKTVQALRDAGYAREADAVEAVRAQKNWSPYVRRLLESVQQELDAHRALDRLRFLLYSANLQPDDVAWIRKHDAGVRWLGKEEDAAGGTSRAVRRPRRPEASRRGRSGTAGESGRSASSRDRSPGGGGPTASNQRTADARKNRIDSTGSGNAPHPRRGTIGADREETAMTGKTKRAVPKRSSKTALAKPMPALPGAGAVDQRLVDKAVAEINRLHRIKKFEAVRAIGDYVLETFFEGRFDSFHHHGRKHASFRAVARHEGLEVSHVTLRNAVAFVEQMRLLPTKVANALPYSHHRALLPVTSVEEKKALAEKAVEKGMSSRVLEQEVRKIRTKPGARRGPGRHPAPAFILAFRRLEKVAAMAASEAVSPTVFTRFAVEDAGELAEAAEKHLAKLGEIVEKVKAGIVEFKRRVEEGKAG